MIRIPFYEAELLFIFQILATKIFRGKETAIVILLMTQALNGF